MKLTKTKFSSIFPLLILPTGWAALGLVIFSKPGLFGALDIFASSALGNFRKVAVFGIFVLAFLVVLILSFYWVDRRFRSGKFFDFLSPIMGKFTNSPYKRYWLICLLLLALLFLQLSLRGWIDNELDSLLFALIRPLLVWGFILTILSFVYGLLPADESIIRVDDFWKVSGVLFLIFFGAGLILQLLGFGHSESSRIAGNFELTAYPILGYQVLLAAVPALFVSFLIDLIPENRINKIPGNKKAIDLIICLALMFSALVIWKAYPIQTHMFYDQPRPPNFEIYPNSDSNVYDRTALNLLTNGEMQSYTYRFDDFVGRRPYLVLYLAALHKFTQSDYLEMISVQQVVFSLIPVLIYLLTSSLHTRASGILAALLIIIRERNGLILSNTVTGVHSQLLMSEIPTMVLLIFFLVILNKGLVTKSKSFLWLLSAGGILGIAMLIRQEVIVLLPFIFFGIFLINRKNFAGIIKQAGTILAAVMIVISPWIFRNWQVSGKVFFDIPGNRLYSIYQTFGIDPNWWKKDHGNDSEVNLFPVEENSINKQIEFSNFSNVAKIGSVSVVEISDSIRIDSYLNRAGYVLNHFVNHLVQSIVYLPSYPVFTDIDYLSKAMIGKLDRYYGGVLYSPQSYVKTLPYFWPDWNGKIPLKSILPSIGTVFLITLGISVASKKHRITAIVPLFSFLGYITIYSLVRASGGRFFQEIDWISMVYFSIGLVALLKFALFDHDPIVVAEQLDPGQKTVDKDQGFWIWGLVLVSLLILIGFMPVLVERLIPQTYPEEIVGIKIDEVLSSIELSDPVGNQKMLTGFLDSGAVAVFGRAYYPRFFEADENLVDIRDEVLGKMDDRYLYDRTEFYLIGSDTTWVVLKSLIIPETIPNGSEIVAIGCQLEGVMDAVGVVVLGDRASIKNIYWRDGIEHAPISCPFPILDGTLTDTP